MKNSLLTNETAHAILKPQVAKQNGGENVVRTDKIAGLLAEHHIMRKDAAKAIGRTTTTLCSRLKPGGGEDFTIREAQILIDMLGIEDPASIFFAKNF